MNIEAFILIVLLCGLCTFLGMVLQKQFNQQSIKSTREIELQALLSQLKESEQERTELLQFLAHDIRTPLTSLRLVSDELLETAETENLKIKDSFKLLVQELHFFEKLTEDLFYLAKITESRGNGALPEVDIATILNEEIERVRTLDSESNKTFIYSGPDTFQFRGEASFLRRMFRNALSNSAKYAHRTINIELKCQQNNIEIAFKDDGCGFSSEHLQYFGQRRPLRFRSGAERDAKISLGLGSVILKQIAERHGGEVFVMNWSKDKGKLGGGSLVINLPCNLTQPILTRSKFFRKKAA